MHSPIAVASRFPGLQLHPENPGPISPHVKRFLELQGIHIAEPVRFPRQVMESDLQSADLVVAVKEVEHRPRLARDFGPWVDRVEFWQIRYGGLAAEPSVADPGDSSP
jgi:low molecular weight protein-tyrosine phosphatase